MMHHVFQHLSDEDYQALYDSQNGCCAICGVHQSELEKKLHIDHNHETMEVRGLLCHACNLGLGYFRDNEQILLSAIEYLRNCGSGVYLSENPIGRKKQLLVDWRDQSFSDEDIQWIINSPVGEVMDRYKIARSTAFVWKSRLLSSIS